MTEDENEAKIKEIMREKNCTYENAKARLRSAQVANFVLNPQLFKPLPMPKPKQVEQVEESEPIDEIAEQKTRILDKIEQELDDENEFADLVSIPEWRDILTQYIFALRMTAEGKADYFLQTVRADVKNNLLHFQIDYYKNGLRIEPMEIYHSVVQEDEGEE